MHSSFQKRNVMPREKYHITIKLNQYTNIAAIKYLQSLHVSEKDIGILSPKSYINFFHIAE